jgi:peptidoglycan/LPS O-acetylase OafA/YrhL
VHQPLIPSLTGLRFVAAFSVAFGHTIPATLILFGTSPHGLTAIGIPLFFTLSGFIIHYSYADAFVSGWRRAAADFSVARFSRIYPLYFAFLLLMLVASPMGARLIRTDALPLLGAYVLGVTTWVPLAIDGKILGQWHYGISWSVSTEFFFYVCYGLLLYRIARIRDLRRAVGALAVFVFIAIAVLVAIFLTCDRWEPWALAAFPGFSPRMQDFDNSFARWALYFSPYAQLPGFICGVLTCQIHFLIRRRGPVEGLLPDAAAWGAAAGIVLLWVELQWLGTSGQWLRLSAPADIFVALHMNMLLVPLCCMLMLALATRATAVGALLSTSTALFLGEISYSIYLSHPITVGLSARMLSGFPIAVRVLVTLGAIVAVSVLLYRLIEAPARQLLRRAWLDRLRNRAGRPVPARRTGRGSALEDLP